MHNVLKPSSISFKSEPVMIPDAVIVKQPIAAEAANIDISNADLNLSAYSDEDKKRLEDYFEKRKTALLSNINSEKSRLDELAKKIVSEAEEKARKLIEEAEKTASETVASAEEKSAALIEDAEQEAVEIRKNAEIQGIEEGRQQVANKVSDCIVQLNDFMIALKNAQKEHFDEMAPQLKYLAADVAESLIFRKIDEDDKLLSDLVIRTLKEFKGAEWINVEVSEQMAGLVDQLVELQKKGSVAQNVNISTASTEKGDIRVESETNICDASISTQLRNIRSYFDSFGEEYDSESGDSNTQT